MKKKLFTKEEIESLSKNENVTRCSEKAISYRKSFKIKAVNLYNQEGLMPREIFEQAGFDLRIIGKGKPDSCLYRWRTSFNLKGKNGLSIETRGRGRSRRKPSIKNLTDADKIKRMEIEIAYLKEENDFLAKLRAKRRE